MGAKTRTFSWPSLLFLAVVILGAALLCWSASRTVESPFIFVISDDQGTLLYETFVAFHDYCAARGIRYYVVGGSCIGALRNAPPGPPKWDDDIDVLIHQEDKERFLDADVEEAWFPFDKNLDHLPFWQLRLKDERRCKSSKEYYLDLYFMFQSAAEHSGEPLYIVEWTPLRALGHAIDNGIYTQSDFHASCMPCAMWGRRTMCPTVIIERNYPDWETKVRLWNHAEHAEEQLEVSDPAARELLQPYENDHIRHALGHEGKSVAVSSSCFRPLEAPEAGE